MSGDDLAKKLRDLGFTEVKGRMTALDDFMVLQIQGTLEAHGLIPESQKGSADLSGGGLVLKKKKKKLGAAAAGDTEAPETPPAEPEPAPAAEPEPEAAKPPLPKKPVEPPVEAPIEPEEPTSAPRKASTPKPVEAAGTPEPETLEAKPKAS